MIERLNLSSPRFKYIYLSQNISKFEFAQLIIKISEFRVFNESFFYVDIIFKRIKVCCEKRMNNPNKYNVPV